MSKRSSKKNIPARKKNKKPSFVNQRNILIIAIIAALIISSYFLFFRKGSSEPEWVREGEVTFISRDSRQPITKIEIEAAVTPAERSQGLMYRSQMDEDKGMLSVEKMDWQSFWMKNTLMSLDIMFIDDKGVINTIHKKTVPYSEKSLPSKQRSQFVVEVVGGFSDKHGIKEGDLIEYKLEPK